MASFYIFDTEHWDNPRSSSSGDYFNACSTDLHDWGLPLYSVAQNYNGYQTTRPGNGYGGFYAAITPSNYYEFLSVTLTQPLLESHVYDLTFFLSVADSFYWHPNHLQFINHLSYNFCPTSESDSTILVCYYIDDVSIVGCTGENPPNVYTPNGDGKNDVISITNVPERKLNILTVGEILIYTSTDLNWNGLDCPDRT